VKVLDVPADHWRDKRDHHKKFFFISVAIFIAIGSLGGFGIVALHHQLFTPPTVTESTNAPIPEPSIAALLVQSLRTGFPVVVCVVGLLWVLKILARILLSQLHLWADAQERCVMVQVYLAMLLGKGMPDGAQLAVDRNDLTIILTQLFRHGSTGMYDDDAAPQIPTALMSLIGGKLDSGKGK
jgi:nitrate reductase NapE component